MNVWLRFSSNLRCQPSVWRCRLLVRRTVLECFKESSAKIYLFPETVFTWWFSFCDTFTWLGLVIKVGNIWPAAHHCFVNFLSHLPNKEVICQKCIPHVYEALLYEIRTKDWYFFCFAWFLLFLYQLKFWLIAGKGINASSSLPGVKVICQDFSNFIAKCMHGIPAIYVVNRHCCFGNQAKLIWSNFTRDQTQPHRFKFLSWPLPGNEPTLKISETKTIFNL